ncbi:MAG: secretin N-terminal domain-containing protein, partial [Phycisphaerales bacterium]
MASTPSLTSLAIALVAIAGTTLALAPARQPTPAQPAPTAPPPSQPAPQSPAPAQPADASPAPTNPATPSHAVPVSSETLPATTQPATPAPSGVTANGSKPTQPKSNARDASGRRLDMGEPTTLSFPKATVEQIIPFIVETTGKVVIPQQDVLARRITILNDTKIPRQQALDLVFLALQQSGVAVVESKDIILLRDQAKVDQEAVPVLGPSQTTLDRHELGSVVQKVFALKTASAVNVGEIIRPSVPDFAKLAIDADSNHILITGPVSLLQRLEKVISELDKPKAEQLVARTFHLDFADAEQIANNIRELYLNNSGTGRALNQGAGLQLRPNNQPGGQQGGRQPGQQGGAGAAAAPQFRVTSNTQQNAVTVLAESAVVDQIEKQIYEEWDKPIPVNYVTPKVYDLHYTDPIKVKAFLEGTFGTGAAGGGGRQPTANPLSGQFTFQAVPEAGRLIVVAKRPDQIKVIDQMIADIDKPMTSGLPEIIDLKHANAEELAEQLNALLAQEGTLAQIRRSASGLTAASSSQSPFSSNQSTGVTGDVSNQFARETPTDTLTFWWQRGRVPTDNFGSSNLVGKARIVPVARQNSVMVMANLEYKAAIAQLIERLDRPGRQVLLAAIVVELAGEDFDSLGVRFSNSAITPSKQDGTIGVSGQDAQGNAVPMITGQQNNLLGSLFTTSTLNVGVDINFLLQALAQKTKVRILSEPRIFTGDNQEAVFFDGKDIPFITDTQTPTGSNQNIVNSFDYKAVGLSLRVRPRITPQRFVDLKINLQLSSIAPEQTSFGSFIIDRRETTTQLIVSDGQTVVISGIIRSEDSEIVRKLPGLGDIPLFGELFTQREKSKTNTELVCFVTPVVVNNPEDADRTNTPYRGRLDEMRKEMGVRDPLDAERPVPPGSQPPADPGPLGGPSGGTPPGSTPPPPVPPLIPL